MPLFLLFLAVPLIEIALFILIGGKIGVFATLAMVLVTAIAGSALLRWQGMQTLNRIRHELENNRLPARPIADGAMIAVAGLLLLTPGFFTDFCGFMLFLPGVRSALWTWLASRIKIVNVTDADSRAGSGPFNSTPSRRYESEFHAEPNPESPWRGGNN